MHSQQETTPKQRLAIVNDCLENGRNYGATARKHNVSAHQLRQWVKKYIEFGEDGLEDNSILHLNTEQLRAKSVELEKEITELQHEIFENEIKSHILSKMCGLEEDEFLRRQGIVQSMTQKASTTQ